MEDIHGVDVSWLHHANRDHHRQQAPSSPGLSRDAPPKTSAHGTVPPAAIYESRKPPTVAPPVQEVAIPSPPPVASPPGQKASPKRPPLLARGSSEKPSPDSRANSRRNSWISSISSKFSSQNSPAQTSHAQAQGSPATPTGAHGTTSSANGALNGIQAANGVSHAGPEPYIPQNPKGSFISNALRRLSSGSQVGGGKVAYQGGLCPRKVMNIDPNRDRCLVPELDQNKLRRVAFCVDVEIAGGPRYKDDVDAEEKKKKRKEKRLKEKGEGEALKHPESLAQEKEQDGSVTVNERQDKEAVGNDNTPDPEGTIITEEKKDGSKKREKKKRSEAERKERKEKKRKKAEENGSIPLELTRDDEDASSDRGSAKGESPPSRPQDRPTTDPLRIYRRCCQLRETPILKRISDQLSAPKALSLVAPGTVTCLDLTGSRLQLADVVTLSDWLAVVPVKKLFLEDADLTDEKVRVILAGLLAAKVPEGPRRKSARSTDSSTGQGKAEERSGVIFKLVLKNNPKIGAEGWRHISLFTYMCKSIKALDVSMIPFPRPPARPSSPITFSTPEHESSTNRQSKDVADVFSKAISERLGGSNLEELIMAECSLTASTIRKIVDGVVISGVQRLGLAGNDIGRDGFEHVLHYIKSGVCQGIDLGGNDLQVECIKALTGSLTKDTQIWAICLADCSLTSESLKILLPTLVGLPNLRFLDLSHNQEVSSQSSLCLLRKYLPQLTLLKRLHLMGVDLTPEHAIGLAEVLPECPQLAHINILENRQIAATATATDEATQEEAAALYASLMVAARVSHTLICVDVDVPGPDSSEVVKALAKQVVAYCLRNMENIPEFPELKESTALQEIQSQKEVQVPEVLMHLVGHTEGFSENHDNDPPAPDEDYIVGGTGVVKALSYCLLQKATDIRRQSVANSGTVTPRNRTEDFNDSFKAKAMSKNLLESARSIRSRLQPALVREARAGNDMGFRRLLFLDQTLQGMIQRFEDEYPETRVRPIDAASTNSSAPSTSPPASSVPTLSSTTHTDLAVGESDNEDDEPKALRSRHNSDVSLASRALSLEEGRLHRLGHRVRTELLNPSRPSSSHSEQANVSGTMDEHDLPEHLVALRQKFLAFSGEELRQKTESVGWEKAFEQIVDNAEQLKSLEQENPEEFARFRESQIAALKNRNPELNGHTHEREDAENDFAVED